MVKLPSTTTAKGFAYSGVPQLSPEWQSLRIGKVGASQLGAWLATSKPTKDGTVRPLKARLDLEKQLAFEKAFNTSFSIFTTSAMQAGIDNEPRVREAYEQTTGRTVQLVGCFYSDHFVASPDGLVGDDGGIEIKWLQDPNFVEVLTTNKPLDDHYLQIQGNLYATDRKWWDYVVGNPNTERFVIIRVERDEDTIKRIASAVKEVTEVQPLDTKEVYTLPTAGASAPTTNEENPWT